MDSGGLRSKIDKRDILRAWHRNGAVFNGLRRGEVQKEGAQTGKGAARPR